MISESCWCILTPGGTEPSDPPLKAIIFYLPTSRMIFVVCHQWMESICFEIHVNWSHVLLTWALLCQGTSPLWTTWGKIKFSILCSMETACRRSVCVMILSKNGIVPAPEHHNEPYARIKIRAEVACHNFRRQNCETWVVWIILHWPLIPPLHCVSLLFQVMVQSVKRGGAPSNGHHQAQMDHLLKRCLHQLRSHNGTLNICLPHGNINSQGKEGLGGGGGGS